MGLVKRGIGHVVKLRGWREMRGGDRDRRDESEKPRWRQYKNEGEEKNENHCLQD